MANDVSRKGSFLEKLISRLFDRIGFDTKLNSKEFGFESDVIAKKKGFIIIVEAKQYEGYINLGALIDQWANRAKRTGVDRVLLVVTGHKNIPEKYYNLAKQEGIYLWDEETVHNLNDIETKEKLYYEVGKKLEFTEIVAELEKKAKKIRKIKIISIAVIAILLIGFFIYSFNFQSPQNDNSKNVVTENNLNNIANNSQQQVESQIQKTPEEELLDFCKIKFKETSSYTELKNFYYFESYSEASSWIENKYPNEGLTINRARFFKGWYLDKAEFPIYILEGTRKIDSQVLENGEYVCDKTGILTR